MCNSKKKCRVCLEEKDLCEFYDRKESKDGKRSECKYCRLDLLRKRNGIDPKRYLITKKEKQELFERGLKRCPKCKENKNIDEFCIDKRQIDGLRNNCRSCELDRDRKSNNIDPKKYKLTKKETEQLYKQQKQRCGCCKEIKHFSEFSLCNANNTGRKHTCKTCISYKSIISRKKRSDLDKRKYNKKQRERSKNRRINDTLYKLTESIRNLISRSLKNKGYSKKTRTHGILGCSYEDFKSHIESKFEPWMTWENRGLYNGTENYGWDLDHIIPISSATTEEEVLKLNHYTNFQPLCSYINRVVKRDRLDY